MANLMKMMKQAATLQKDMKKVQKELAKKTVEFQGAGGRIRITARGDMSVEKIDIDADYLESADPNALGRSLVSAVNGALTAAKKEAGKEMAKIGSALGLPGDMLQ